MPSDFLTGLPLIVAIPVCSTYYALLVVLLESINWVLILWSLFIVSLSTSAPLLVLLRLSPLGGAGLTLPWKLLLILTLASKLFIHRPGIGQN